jgi:hypothetical protein
MNRRLHAVFDDEEKVISATDACRERGYEIIDVHTPYPVHGLIDAMGLKPSRMPFLCFLFGVLGAAGMFGFQVWASAVDWPANIGGKPLNSAPAFLPVTFETAVLFAGLGIIFTLLLRSKLFPFQKPKIQDARLTDDHFLLAIRQTDADLHPDMAKNLFLEHGAIEVTEIPQEEAR